MPDPLIGQILGDYQVLELLGRGGMARVYRGYDERLARYAAVKVTDSEIVTEELREEYEMRFSREARAIAHLQHPNIVGVYQFGQIEGLNFMAMHFIDGQDLRFILRHRHERNDLMPYDQVMRIIRDIASALDYAHRHGVIHRDVKPSNIMVKPDGTAILTDFGLALNIPEGTIGNTFGSAHYIAPEQAVSSAQSVPQSDFYSLGVILYEMVTGKVPFDDPSTMSVALKHLNEPPPLPSTINPHISPEVEDVIMRMLRKDPRDRYPDGATMVKALEAAFKVAPEAAALPDEEDTAEIPVVPPGPATVGPILRPDIPAIPTDSRPGSTSDSGTIVYVPTPGKEKIAPSPAVAPRRRSRRALAALALLVILGSAAALLARGAGLFGSSGHLDTATPTASNTVAAASATRTVEPGRTAYPTPRRTVVPVAIGGETPTSAPAPTHTPTATQPGPTTAPPSVTPRTPTLTSTAGDAQLLLLYDNETAQIINQSSRYINILPLEFRRYQDGHIVFFQTADLATDIARPGALPPGQCFQVWPIALNRTAPNMPYNTEECSLRVGWRMLSSDRLFWLDNTPGAEFEVIAYLEEGEVPLGTCAVAEGRCTIFLPYE